MNTLIFIAVITILGRILMVPRHKKQSFTLDRVNLLSNDMRHDNSSHTVNYKINSFKKDLSAKSVNMMLNKENMGILKRGYVVN